MQARGYARTVVESGACGVIQVGEISRGRAPALTSRADAVDLGHDFAARLHADDAGGVPVRIRSFGDSVKKPLK